MDLCVRHVNLSIHFRYLGDGLVTISDHDKWSVRRKNLDPMFHRQQLRNSIDVFNSTGDCFIEELCSFAESGETFELNPIFHRTTLDVIMRVSKLVDVIHKNF